MPSNNASFSNKVSPPAGFNWPFATYPITIYRSGSRYGSQISTDFVAESYINPLCYANVYHVATTGSDSNSGQGSYPGDFSQALASINVAITKGNATSAPFMVLVQAGVYIRTASPSGSSSSVYNTQDMAMFAYGGRVVTGPFDALTWSLTTGATYQATRSNAYAVYDLLNFDEFSNYKTLPLAASLAACESTAGTWYTDGTTTYVHRLDGAAVTNANTRVYLNVATGSGAALFLNSSTAANIYCGPFGGEPNSGFDFEGGSGAVLLAAPSSVRTANSIFVNCTFKYPSAASGSTFNCVSFNQTHGLAAFVNCTAQGAQADGFNFHNVQAGVPSLFPLLINCTANGNGVMPQTSCNGYTFHDGISGIDVNGTYGYNYGGNVACVLGVSTTYNTQIWCVGTKAFMSRGDHPLGGTQGPRDYWMSGIAGSLPCQMWLDGCYGGNAISNSQTPYTLFADSSAVIYTRNFTNASNSSSGTVTPY